MFARARGNHAQPASLQHPHDTVFRLGMAGRIRGDRAQFRKALRWELRSAGYFPDTFRSASAGVAGAVVGRVLHRSDR